MSRTLTFPTVMHLTASPSYGGPERQMLELGNELRGAWRSVYATFQEEGRCWDFIRRAEAERFEAHALRFDTPRFLAALRELIGLLQNSRANVLFCHGYKAGILGRIAARRVGIPAAAISRGWTGETVRVRLFDFLDRINLRWLDRVICVSEGQAAKVRRAGVRQAKITVIRNAIRPGRFANPEPAYRDFLCRMFPEPPALIVGAAGRLSPEKGFGVFVDAAARVLAARDADSSSGSESERRRIGFVLFGDGPLRDSLTRQIAALGLEGRFILGDFNRDLDRCLPHFDLLVLPSYTEGLPNVALEAMAAGVPVVATAVGGTPEVVVDGQTGYLVAAGDPVELARRIAAVAFAPDRREMGLRGREKVEAEFSFAAQARAYVGLLNDLLSTTTQPIAAPSRCAE